MGSLDEQENHVMNTVCVGTNEDLEKEYLRLTGVSVLFFLLHI